MYVTVENLRDVINNVSKSLAEAKKVERQAATKLNKYDKAFRDTNDDTYDSSRELLVNYLRKAQKNYAWFRSLVRCLTIALGIMKYKAYETIEGTSKTKPNWQIIHAILTFAGFNDTKYPYSLPWKTIK